MLWMKSFLADGGHVWLSLWCADCEVDVPDYNESRSDSTAIDAGAGALAPRANKCLHPAVSGSV